jgi:hypothetical protein
VKSFSSIFFLQTINNIGKNVILGKVSVHLATDHVQPLLSHAIPHVVDEGKQSKKHNIENR